MTVLVSLIRSPQSKNNRGSVAYINDKLKQYGIDLYKDYPREISCETKLPSTRWKVDYFEYLKFIAAQAELDENWSPDENYKPQKISEDLKSKLASEKKSHLISHSSFFGYFVPVDFQGTSPSTELLSGIGSSISLCKEIQKIAKCLQLDLREYKQDLSNLYKDRGQDLNNDLVGFERWMTLSLYNITIASIKHNLIIELI